MYNREIKERYVEEKRSYTTVADYYFSSLFNKTNKFEEELDKDVSNFTTYEIINMYKTLSLSSLDGIAMMNSNLSMYTQWCIQESLVKDFQNHYIEINRDMMVSLLNKNAIDKKIIDRQQILNWCTELPNPSDSFCLLALFEGIKGTGYLEIAYAKIEDFNENIFTSYQGREIVVSDKLIDYAIESNETLEYQSITKAMLHRVVLEDNGRIIKNYGNIRNPDSLPTLRRRIQSRLTRIFDYLGIVQWMNGNDIRMSGIIYMINQRCKELDITARDYIFSDYTTEIKKQYDFNLIPSIFWDKYNQYLA